MTAQELHAIVSVLPEERWRPDGLLYVDDAWWIMPLSHRPSRTAITTAHALLIWEGHLSRIVNEAWLTEYSYGGWLCDESHPTQETKFYPTRIEALVAAVKGLE